MTTKRSYDRKRAIRALFVPALILILIWAIHLITQLEDISIVKFGVHPRHTDGLPGIILSPLIHSPSDINHIFNNSVPMFVLTWALYYFYKDIATKILLVIWLTTGLCVWTSANPNSYHIGISGVIYGLAGFLFFSGVIRRNKHLLALALLVAFEYGGMVWGIFPLEERMSWESHLWGGIVGAVMAFYFRADGPKRRKYQWEIEEELGLDKFEGDYWKTPEQIEKETRITYEYKEKRRN